MGFFTRHITDNSLKAFAKGELSSFHTYMTNSEAYNLTGDYTSPFWHFYNEEKESRESLWNILRSKSEDKEYFIKTVCNLWEAATGKKNNLNQIDKIANYLGSKENPESFDECSQVRKLIRILKERVNKNIENE